MISDSGFINSELFVDWIKYLKYDVKPTEDDPVLLILENHMSHCSLEAVFCGEHHITLLSLPPHSSHRLQPLDRGFFGPLKTVYTAEADTWMHNHPGLAILQSDICLIFRNAYEWVANMEKAKHAFQAKGIHPFKPDVFFDEDFLPSEVTDRPQGSLNEDPTGETNKELQMPMSTEKIAAENNTCANSLVKKSQSDGDEEEPERARIFPSNIFPV
jgi:hypothetical protein